LGVIVVFDVEEIAGVEKLAFGVALESCRDMTLVEN